jgi:mlo protein
MNEGLIHALQIAFLKQFHDSVSKSDYEALRSAFVLVRYIVLFNPCMILFHIILYAAMEANRYYHPFFHFIQRHYPSRLDFDFHKYMTRALEHDFKRVVGIRLV